MGFDISKRHIFSRRVAFVLTCKLIIISVIIAKLFKMQVIDKKKYQILALLNSTKIALILQKRGAILDRNNKAIVENRKIISIAFDDIPLKKNHMPQIKLFYKYIFDGNITEIDKHMGYVSRFAKNFPNNRIILWRNISKDKLMKIEYYFPLLKGITIFEDYERVYNYGANASHVIGYVAPISQEMIKKVEDPILRKIYSFDDFKVGISGIEKYKENILSGTYGINQLKIDSLGSISSQTAVRSPIDGTSVKTTLNMDVQNKLYELMQKYEINGAGVVIDIENGHIIAMQSMPSYDPANLSKWSAVKSNLGQVFSGDTMLNKVSGQVYPPGSIFKIVSAISILASGIDPDKKFLCKGEYKHGPRIAKCWKEGGHGYVNLDQAVAHSCNPYFFDTCLNVNIDLMHDIASELSFGSKLGMDFTNEAKGLMPNKAWKKAVYNDKWYSGDTMNASIGQGFITATPIQFCILMARIASGKKVTPSIIFDANRQFEHLNIDTKYLDMAKSYLHSFCSKEYGNLYRKKNSITPLDICGKTATAQVISKNLDLKSTAHYNKNMLSNGMFAGFSTYQNPKYATCIVAEHSTWGSVVAAPVGIEILKFAHDITEI